MHWNRHVWMSVLAHKAAVGCHVIVVLDVNVPEKSRDIYRRICHGSIVAL